MAETVSLTKSVNGDYELTIGGYLAETFQFPRFEYVTNAVGVKLKVYNGRQPMKRFYKPSEWTINGVSGFATIKDVTDAITVLDIDLKIPTGFTSAFTVDTILGQLNWTDANSGIAEYEVYSSTNGGADILLTTTVSGATSYQDATCKQNASVVYKIRAKKGIKFSDLVSATALSTPLCWKTDQSVLTSVVINQLTLAAGKSVTVNWGDGTSQTYSGDNLNITKNYGATGQYNIWLSGDTNFILRVIHGLQPKSYGSVTNWVLPSTLEYFRIHSTGLTGSVTNWVLPSTLITIYLKSTGLTGSVTNWVLPSTLITMEIQSTGLTGSVTNWVLPSAMIVLNIQSTSLTGSLPQITSHATNDIIYQAQSCSFSDSNVTVFRKAMSVFNVGSQNVTFPTANIDKLLKALADWYQVNAPTANCTFTLSGSNMGIPTGGSSNDDIVRLVGYYTAAGKSCTILVRTS